MSSKASAQRNQKASPAAAQAGAPPATNLKPVLRWSLTLSSLAMLAFAVLTFAGVLPFQSVIGYLFLVIAAVDLLIAYVVFGK